MAALIRKKVDYLKAMLNGEAAGNMHDERSLRLTDLLSQERDGEAASASAQVDRQATRKMRLEWRTLQVG